MAALEAEIAYFEERHAELEARHMGKRVLIHSRELVGLSDDFDGAAAAAV